jgi:hypothetical protein
MDRRPVAGATRSPGKELAAFVARRGGLIPFDSRLRSLPKKPFPVYCERVVIAGDRAIFQSQ